MRAGVIAAVLVSLMFLFSGTAAAAPLGVEAFVVGPAKGAEAVVTVRNSGTAPADVVSVELRQGRGSIGAQRGGRLVAGQAAVFRFPVGKDAYAAGRLYVLVQRRTGTTLDTTAVPVAPPPKAPEKKGLGTTAVTTLFSVGSLLAGIVVTDLLARRRERSQSRLEARRTDVERDTPAYRAFIADWQGSIAPAHLTSAFTALLGAAGVPDRVQEVYRETLARLNDPAASAEAKREAASRLRRTVEDLTRTPSLD